MRHIAFFGFCGLVIIILVFVVVRETQTSLERREPSYAVSSSSLSAAASSSASSVPGKYGVYDPRDVASGTAAVLFFADSRDPFSAKHDLLLQKLSRSGALRLPVYRLEFASHTGARITYGAVIPDTFVILDAKAKRASSLIHPTDAELLGAVSFIRSSSSSSRKK